MKYLVTGASGFAGGYLADELVAEGHDVVGIVRRPGALRSRAVTERVADLQNPKPFQAVVAETDPDGIFHLAAPFASAQEAEERPDEAIAANLETTRTVLEAARLHGNKRVLFTSSIQAEDPQNAYGRSKKSGEELLESYRAKHGTPSLIVRPSNHIGPGQTDLRYVAALFVRKVLKAEQDGSGEVTAYGLDETRDFTDVRDMVRAYSLVMGKGEAGACYPIASGKEVSLRTVLELLTGHSAATINIVEGDAGNPTPRTSARPDTSEIFALGYQPRIPLQQTLADMLDAAREDSK